MGATYSKLSHGIYSLDYFCIKAEYMKNKARVWTLVVWTKTFTFVPLAISLSCFLHAVVRALFVLSVLCGHRKLRVAVDRDARQVVPDDLVDCGGNERNARSLRGAVAKE